MKTDNKKLLEIAYICSAHGIKGEVKLKSFSENFRQMSENTQFYTAPGDVVAIHITGYNVKHKQFIVRINQIHNRNEAETWVGQKIFISKDSVVNNKEDEEYYHTELIGLTLYLKDQTKYGEITAVYNFGAGDIIEVMPQNASKVELFSFTKDIILEIDLAQKRAIIDPPLMY